MWLPVVGSRGSSFLRSFVLSYWLMNRLQQLKTTRLQMPMEPIVVDGALPEKRAAVLTKKLQQPPNRYYRSCRAQGEKAGEKSMKKKAPTLTSTLTARSKAAYGLSNKPKVQIVVIDAADVNNHLAVVEYVDEIYKSVEAVLTRENSITGIAYKDNGVGAYE
ncbi:G2/mitotic-specific cyclin-1-like [Sesamum indicum]|uniref:G2/mitotic-specific cyclin-1-like n=1 Tax=Sesamum indicum TaxID=4182 RepID=A0A8M8USU3_SESIN|nr:G2/mitotic-specific cyclin-1-like [Sesamum indicum]XP_020549593.1 G2/mitotic-specific cyclin-1-like [Sesamum indicum]